MPASRLLRKKLTYRDRAGRSLLSHALHWQGFTWQAGNTIVRCYGPWGQIQCWASTEAEGRRVISHALDGGGWGGSAAAEAEWLVDQASGTRNGRGGTMKTKETNLGVEVTKRDGPSGTAGMA